jgi:hypothetical protein
MDWAIGYRHIPRREALPENPVGKLRHRRHFAIIAAWMFIGG